MKKMIGIDLGSTALRAGTPGDGIVMREPAVVAVSRIDGKRKRFGTQAVKLTGTDETYSLSRPFRAGIFSDCELAQQVIAWCLKSTYPNDSDVRTLCAIPCGLDQEQEASLVELAAQAGAGETFLVYSPVAALAGAGYSLEKNYLAVDIGAFTTDIALLSEGEMIYHSCIDCAGDAFTEAIAAYINKKHRLRINYRTAEDIKRKIGTVWVEGERRQMEIAGRGATDEIMHRALISSDEMFAALEEPCAAVLKAVCDAIAKIPLSVVRSTFEQGIFLTGGGASLEGLDRMIAGVTGVKCIKDPDPENSVALGLTKILPRLPEHIHIGGGNVSDIAIKTNSYLD